MKGLSVELPLRKSFAPVGLSCGPYSISETVERPMDQFQFLLPIPPKTKSYSVPPATANPIGLVSVAELSCPNMPDCR